MTTQPTTLRAHAAMVDAYVAAGNYAGALSEVDRFKQTAPVHPDLPFVDARIRFASGDVDRAAAELRTALDTVAPQDFRPIRVRRASSATSPPRPMSLRIRETCPTLQRRSTWPTRCARKSFRSPRSGRTGGWRRSALGDLYAATGGPTASLRQVWQSAAEAGRMVSAEQRKHVAHCGASAAIGLFTGPAATAARSPSIRR